MTSSKPFVDEESTKSERLGQWIMPKLASHGVTPIFLSGGGRQLAEIGVMGKRSGKRGEKKKRTRGASKKRGEGELLGMGDSAHSVNQKGLKLITENPCCRAERDIMERTTTFRQLFAFDWTHVIIHLARRREKKGRGGGCSWRERLPRLIVVSNLGEGGRN